MRKNYWVDAYKLREELLKLLRKHGLEFMEVDVRPPTPLCNDRLEGNGAIALVCEDAEHPDLPTSICTHLGHLNFVRRKSKFYGNTNKENSQAFVKEASEMFGLIPVEGRELYGQILHRYAVTKLPWRPTAAAFRMPVFTGMPVGKEIEREYAKARRMCLRVLHTDFFPSYSRR